MRKRDQMLPLHVLHVAGDIPGLPGLFMAGVFSGSLSTISSGLNSLAAISLQFLPGERLRAMSSVKQALLTKVFSALYGLVGYGLTYAIKFMPGMLEAAMIIGGVSSGPGIGVFTLGLLVPWVSSTGVTTGFITSLLVSTWVATGGTLYRQQAEYRSSSAPRHPNTTAGCPPSWLQSYNSSSSLSSQPYQPLPGHLPIYEAGL